MKERSGRGFRIVQPNWNYHQLCSEITSTNGLGNVLRHPSSGSCEWWVLYKFVWHGCIPPDVMQPSPFSKPASLYLLTIVIIAQQVAECSVELWQSTRRITWRWSHSSSFSPIHSVLIVCKLLRQKRHLSIISDYFPGSVSKRQQWFGRHHCYDCDTKLLSVEYFGKIAPAKLQPNWQETNLRRQRSHLTGRTWVRGSMQYG